MEPNPHTPRPRLRTMPTNEHAGAPRAVPRRAAIDAALPPTPRPAPPAPSRQVGPPPLFGVRILREGVCLSVMRPSTSLSSDVERPLLPSVLPTGWTERTFAAFCGVTPEAFALFKRLFIGFRVYHWRLHGVFRNVSARLSVDNDVVDRPRASRLAAFLSVCRFAESFRVEAFSREQNSLGV